MTAALLTVSGVLYYGLALALGLFCWFQWRYRDLLRVAARLPVTFPAWPLLGHGYFMFWGLEEGTNYILQMIHRAIDQGLKTMCFWVGPLPYIIALDVDDVRLVMNSAKTIDKSDEYLFFKDGLDTDVGPMEYSMLLAPGPVWKVTRRHMNMMFSPRNLEQMVPVFNANARTLMVRLADRVGRGPTTLDITHLVMDAALKGVCDLLLGVDNKIDIESKEFKGLSTVVDRYTEIFTKRTIYPWLRCHPLFLFFYKKDLEEINSLWKNFTKTPLKATKEKYELKVKKGSHTTREDDKDEPLNIVEVFGTLREKYPQFTESDMWGDMFTLYETGSDTIAVNTSYCLMALAQYPEYQGKVYDEIVSVVGAASEVTLDHIDQLAYLEQCIKETLRRFTLLPLLLRKPSEDIKLSTCTVPANRPIVMCLYAIHMNPRIYPDPNRFDPDRFLPENEAARDRFTFVPFSGGPRDCIGKRYSMMFLKVLLANILRKYRVQPVVDIHKLQRKLSVILGSSEGYHVELEDRTPS